MSTETKCPVWVSCSDCGHEWVLFYTPIAASDVGKFSKSRCPMCVSKKICMGRKPQPVDASGDVGKSDPQVVAEWMLSDDTGVSSEALASCFLKVERKGLAFPPSDPSDLGRCLRLIARVPGVRACVDILAQDHEDWAVAAKIWDQIAASMEEEVGT